MQQLSGCVDDLHCMERMCWLVGQRNYKALNDVA